LRRGSGDCAKENDFRGNSLDLCGKWRGFASATGHRLDAPFLIHVISGTTEPKRNCRLIANELKINSKNNETEQRPRQVIEAAGRVVLDADADDVPVFFHPCVSIMHGRRQFSTSNSPTAPGSLQKGQVPAGCVDHPAGTGIMKLQVDAAV
jgi:hypothetical protein